MWRRITLVARRPCQGLIGHWHGVRWYSRGGKEKQQQRQLKEKNLKTGKSVEDLKEDYQEVMYSRRHKERTDSLSLEMLEDRVRHKKRYEILSKPTPLVREMARLGHGKKTRMKNIYESLEPTEDSWMSKTAPRTATGAGGLATLIGTATKKWPLFKHMLPEIAFAGHSNCGKSTLVNAMIGKSPRGGIAGVSSRAGWTDQIHFYQLGMKPPLLTLVDLPGYGHAVASPKVMKAWKDMTHSYMKQRLILSRVYVLVDCMRGLCEADKSTLTYLEKVILTKCDHLSAEDVAKSALVVYNDLISLKKLLNPAQFESTANLRPKRGHKKKATTSLEDKVESESSSSSDSSDNEDSEVEGEIKIQELIQNGYKLPSGVGKLRSDSMTKSESSKVNSSEEIVDDEGIVHPPPGLQETYEDEDEFIQKTKSNSKSSSFSSSTLTSSSQSSAKTRSPLVITDDGEIIGGFDIDYNNLSSKNYSLLMRSAQQQLAKMKVIRDQEIKEKGSVDYQLEEIPDDELDLHSEDDEDMETDSNQASKEADEDGDLENGNIDDDVTLNEIMNYVLPVSATSGAGIQEMWEDIRRCVIANVVHPPGWEEKDQLSVERKKELTRVVREHRLGNLERRRISEGHDGVVRGSHRS